MSNAHAMVAGKENEVRAVYRYLVLEGVFHTDVSAKQKSNKNSVRMRKRERRPAQSEKGKVTRSVHGGITSNLGQNAKRAYR